MVLGVTVHWSYGPLVRQSIGPTVHWFDSQLVWQPISPTDLLNTSRMNDSSHKLYSPLVRQSIGRTVHWSDSPLVRKIYWIVIINLKYVLRKPQQIYLSRLFLTKFWYIWDAIQRTVLQYALLILSFVWILQYSLACQTNWIKKWPMLHEHLIAKPICYSSMLQ